MATTIDSGTETLFSEEDDESSPPVSCCDKTAVEDTESVNSRLAPPNIQPHSGVLEKGDKMVIRPIAYKPTTLMSTQNGTRFGNLATCSERYSSTPILTRPNSHLTFYGSTNDLHHLHRHHHHHHTSATNNYSLDRKLRSCPASNASPGLVATSINSLTSLPTKLINYDSLESVRKSSISSTADGSIILSVDEGDGSLLDLTPSPSDSGVSELEAALRDRDSELAYLRQTMEHNEQVIFRVYQEKEKVWERELRRIKAIYEQRLRAATQKSLKLEQILMMQTYQQQQDKKRLCNEQQRANLQTERCRQETNVLRARLEQTEWNLCEKTGEISLLKTQLKDYQNEQTNKCQEMLLLRNEYREMRDRLSESESEMAELRQASRDKDAHIEHLQEELRMYKTQPINADQYIENVTEIERLKTEIIELRQELSDLSLSSEYSGIESGRALRNKQNSDEEEDEVETKIESLEGVNACCKQLLSELHVKSKHFENERFVWAQEKEKVLRYQRQLQMNYVQMFRRTRVLEAQLEHLRVQIELEKKSMQTATIEL